MPLTVPPFPITTPQKFLATVIHARAAMSHNRLAIGDILFSEVCYGL
jgi:hypothetical protein